MKCLIHQNVPKPLDGLKKKGRLVRSGGGVLSLQPLVLWEATLQPITLCKATLQPVNTVESYIVACCSMDRYIVYSLLLCGKLPYSVSIPPWRKVDTPSLSHFSLVSWSPVRFFGFDFFFLFANSYSGMAGYFHSCYVLFPEILLSSLVGNTCIGVNKFSHFQQHLHSLFQTWAGGFQPEKLLQQGEGRRARKERCRMCPCQAEHSLTGVRPIQPIFPLNLDLRCVMGVSKVALWVTTFATKPGNLSLVPGAHLVRRKN